VNGNFREIELLAFAVDDKEKDEVIKTLNGANYEVGRFKGLGEMPSQDLKSTTMDKNNRTLIRVTIENNKRTDKTFDRLMGKEAHHRFKFIQERAPFFKDLDV